MSGKGALLGAVVLLVALFFGINILSTDLLRSGRLDLTQEKLYTLSTGAHNIASTVEEPITLRLYYSEEAAAKQPGIQTYARRVREVLEEFASMSDKITLEVIEPEPFSEAEDEAVQGGLTPIPVGPDTSIYLGLVATNSTDGREVVPFFNPQEEQFLDYQIARVIHTLSNPDRTSIAVMSPLPVNGPGMNRLLDPNARPWSIITELQTLFNVNVVEPQMPEIPDGTDVLIVIHPRDLSEEARYNIDQFVLAGGRAIVMVDPFAEVDQPPQDPQNPLNTLAAERGSNLPNILGAWGLQMTDGQFIGDRQNALQVQVQGPGGRPETVPYPGFMRLGSNEGELAGDDPVAGRLSEMIFATPGMLTKKEGAQTTFTPIIRSSPENMLYNTDSAKPFLFNPKDMIATFKSRGEPAVLAARVTGHASSAFAGGELPAFADAAAFIAESQEPINVVVVADVDFITDRFWIRQTIFGYQKLSDNGDFLVGLAENLSGSEDLMSIRARGRAARPFTRVEEIRQRAQDDYLSQEQALEQKRRDTQQKIAQLQQARPEQGGGPIILTPEQQAELEKFQEELLQTRKELRQVRLNMGQEIKDLGLKIKVINIAAMPLLVAIAAIGVGAYRMARRRSDRRRAA